MKIKRLFTTISASIDDLISKVENHEAAASCTIDEVRRAAGKIRAQLNTVNGQYEHLQNERDRLGTVSDQWRARALACRDTDEERALGCLQALNACESRAKDTEQQMHSTCSLRTELQQQLGMVERQLHELHNKRASLQARSARSRAAARSACATSPAELFERWEEAVLAQEYEHLPVAPVRNDLEQEFLAEETQQLLRTQLHALTADGEANARGAQ